MGAGAGTAITNRLKSSAQGGGKPEGVVIETEGGKTFKSRRVVNHVKSCRAAGCDEDRKCPLNLATMRSLILPREASSRMRSGGWFGGS